MVALEKERPRTIAPPPENVDAIPLSLRRRGGTPRQVLAMSVIGTLLLAVFAAPDCRPGSTAWAADRSWNRCKTRRRNGTRRWRGWA